MYKHAFSTAALTAIAASFSYASMANTAGSPWEQTSNLSQSVQIQTTTGSGSGGLYGKSIITRDGVDYLKLCFATADHVTSGATLSAVKFDAIGVTLGAGQADVVQVLGRGHDGNQDLSFLGMQFRVDSFLQRDPGSFSLLNGLDALALGVYDSAAMGSVTSHGYGLSARYLVDGSNNRIGFVWDEDLEDFPVSRGGVHRFVNHSVTAFGNKVTGPYNYDAIKWKTSDKAGEGQINSGDSGGVIAHGSATTFVGVNTYAVGRTGTRASGTEFEEFLYGWEGGGLGFTQQDVDWLSTKCSDFEAVPEPASMMLLGLAALAASRRKRKAA